MIAARKEDEMMTLRMVDKALLESRYVVSTVDGQHIIVDFLGDGPAFCKAIKDVESLYDRKVKYISNSRYFGCLEIYCE